MAADRRRSARRCRRRLAVPAPAPAAAPYLAVLSTYSLLLTAALEPWADPISGIALGAVTMTILVLVRQLLAVRQNVRLLAENAARQNEARFRSLVQHSSDVIMVIKPDLTIRFVSPSVSRVLRRFWKLRSISIQRKCGEDPRFRCW